MNFITERLRPYSAQFPKGNYCQWAFQGDENDAGKGKSRQRTREEEKTWRLQKLGEMVNGEQCVNLTKMTCKHWKLWEREPQTWKCSRRNGEWWAMCESRKRWTEDLREKGLLLQILESCVSFRVSILLLQIRTRNGDDDNKREDFLLEERRLSPARERSIEKVKEESVWGEVRSDGG